MNYFTYIGGYTLKEAVNLCLKESLKDSITVSLTWWGQGEKQPLYNARLTMAIYRMTIYSNIVVASIIIIYSIFSLITIIYCDVSFSEAVCCNKYFDKPTRSEFQTQMKDALRTAKERHRSKVRGPNRRAQINAPSIQRDFWNDEEENQQRDEEANEEQTEENADD